MKKFKWFGTVCAAIIISVCALAGCAEKKLTVGKYCAEENSESYIEILEDSKAIFVNIDLSEVQDMHNQADNDINVTEILSTPTPYETLGDIIYFSYSDGYALRATHDFKNHTITFNDNVYTYHK